MLKPKRTDVPGSLPITRDQAKAHMRVDDDFENDLIDSFITSAVDHVDGYSGILGRCLINQPWSVSACDIYDICLLPFPDVSSAVITYFDSDDVEQTFAAANYSIIETVQGSRIFIKSESSIPAMFARPDAVTVTFVAGYGEEADDVPAPIRQALKMMVAFHYENRDMPPASSTDMTPMGATALLAPYRRVSF